MLTPLLIYRSTSEKSQEPDTVIDVDDMRNLTMCLCASAYLKNWLQVTIAKTRYEALNERTRKCPTICYPGFSEMHEVQTTANDVQLF